MIPSGQPLGGPTSPTSPHRGLLFQLKLAFIPIFQCPYQTVHSPHKEVQLPRHCQDAATDFPKAQRASQHPPMFLAWPQGAVGGHGPGAALPPPACCSEVRPLWGPRARPLNSKHVPWPGHWCEKWQPGGGRHPHGSSGSSSVGPAAKKDGSPRWIWKDDQL